MMVSSPTPPDSKNKCPFCDAIIKLDRSQQFGDTPCPACGQLIWFVAIDGATRVIKPIHGENFESWLVHFLSEKLDVPADDVKMSIRKATAARYN